MLTIEEVFGADCAEKMGSHARFVYRQQGGTRRPRLAILFSILLTSGQCGPQHRYQIHIKSCRDGADR